MQLHHGIGMAAAEVVVKKERQTEIINLPLYLIKLLGGWRDDNVSEGLREEIIRLLLDTFTSCPHENTIHLQPHYSRRLCHLSITQLADFILSHAERKQTAFRTDGTSFSVDVISSVISASCVRAQLPSWRTETRAGTLDVSVNVHGVRSKK